MQGPALEVKLFSAALKRHPIDPDAFTIIGSARTKGALTTLESIQIKLLRPSLNVQSDTSHLLTI